MLGEARKLSAISNQLKDLADAVKVATAKPKLEIAIAELTVCPFASTWAHPPDAKLKTAYPLGKHTAVEIPGFKRYLNKNLKQDAESTVKIYQTAIARLFNIVQCSSGEEVDYMAYMVSLYKQDVVQTLQDLPILSMRYGWSRQIAFALDHLCSYGIAEASKHDMPVTKWHLEQFQHDVLQAWKGDAYEAKAKGSIAKQSTDGLRLEKLPTAANCKAAVRKAMCHLSCLAQKHASGEHLATDERQIANIALAGIIVYNTFAGRSMEWHLMEREAVCAKLSAGENKIVCDKHKTCKYYGSIAKWIPSGLQQAILTYCSLPYKHSSRLLEPARLSEANDKHFHLGPALKAFGQHYTPKDEYPRINLVRKMFHSALLRMSREGEAMTIIGKADGHSADMGLKTYALAGPKEDVAVGEVVYRQVFGDPVEWPTPEEALGYKRSITSTAAALNALMDDLDEQV